MSSCGVVPGLRVAAPRDAATLREELAEAVAGRRRADGAALPEGRGARVACRRCAGVGGVDVLREPRCTPSPDDAGGPAVLLVASAPSAGWRVEAAGRLAAQGIGVTVVDPRWVLPVPDVLVDAGRGTPAGRHRRGRRPARRRRRGGGRRPAGRGVRVPQVLALPQQFLEPGARADLLGDLGLTAQAVARGITEWAAALPGAADRRRGGTGDRAPAGRGGRAVRARRGARVYGRRRSRRADAGAGGGGRARAGRRDRPRAAARGHGRRRRLRRRHGHQKSTLHPVRRRRAGPGPAGDARRRPAAPRSSPRATTDQGADAHRVRPASTTGSTACPCGADDYLSKPFAFPELVARVRALGRRATPAAPPVLRAGDLELDPARRTVTRAGRPIELTRKEFGVLEVLLRRRGTGGVQRGSAGAGLGRERRPVHHHGAGDDDDPAQQARRAGGDRHRGRAPVTGSRRR